MDVYMEMDVRGKTYPYEVLKHPSVQNCVSGAGSADVPFLR